MRFTEIPALLLAVIYGLGALCYFLPCLIWETTTPWAKEKQRRRREARKRASRPAPQAEPPVRSLPAVRSRALTAVSPSSQGQSLLFSRLPAEVRLIIWQHVFGCGQEVLHLDLGDGIVRSARCRDSASLDEKLGFRHLCWHAVWTRGDRLQDGERQAVLMTPLLTCRLMYRESVNLLYSANTFDMRRVETVLRLPHIMLPHRMECIKRFRFSTAFLVPRRGFTYISYRGEDYSAPDSPDQWPQACGILATLGSLEDVQVAIALWNLNPYDAQPTSDEELLYVLTPLKSIRARKFVVLLTEAVDETVRRELGPVPFELYQRTKPGKGFFTTLEDD